MLKLLKLLVIVSKNGQKITNQLCFAMYYTFKFINQGLFFCKSENLSYYPN